MLYSPCRRLYNAKCEELYDAKISEEISQKQRVSSAKEVMQVSS